MTLRVLETPPRRIDFTNVSRTDFERFRGAWTLEREPGGMRVGYAATATPKRMPPHVGPAIMHGTVTTMLRALRAEVLRP